MNVFGYKVEREVEMTINKEFSPENYSFKLAMKQNIEKQLVPVLNNYEFVKFGANKYAREVEGILQIISFRIENDRLKAFATYYPIFVPYDNLLNYGVELTGTTGSYLLDGKYFTTISNFNITPENQIKNYYQKILPSFDKLLQGILEGVLPEMEQVNSLSKFIEKFEHQQVKFFGHNFDIQLKELTVHQYIFQVYACLHGPFSDSVQKLDNIKRITLESEIQDVIQKLLFTEKNTLTREQFILNLTEIVNARRKKYKLKIKSNKFIDM